MCPWLVVPAEASQAKKAKPCLECVCCSEDKCGLLMIGEIQCSQSVPRQPAGSPDDGSTLWTPYWTSLFTDQELSSPVVVRERLCC